MATTVGGARWMNSRWRYRRWGDGPWIYAETLADVKADLSPGERFEVQKRAGSKRAGYWYEKHSVVTR